MEHYIFKIIAVGDGRVGKTSIIRRFVHEEFDPKYAKTIGVAHSVKRLIIEDNEITLVIWDTGGQELFNCVRPNYYRGAHGGLVIFDVTCEESFDHLEKWFTELDVQCGKMPIILIGNKIDLIDDRITLTEEGIQYALKKGVKFYETSAKSGENVVDVMEELAKLILFEAISERKNLERNVNAINKIT